MSNVSEEVHNDDRKHYHMAVTLDRKRWWLYVRNYAEKHAVKLNFSSVHSNYYSTWKYTTKENNDYLQLQDHPDLKKAQPPT